jgi:hypothetical protein
MTAHADTALAFCREVRGWKDAAGAHDVKTVFEHLREEPSEAFQFTDLSSVLTAVRSWCDANDGAVEFSYHGYLPGEWEARVTSSVSLETIVHSDPCHALLAACLEAARKLRGPHG